VASSLFFIQNNLASLILYSFSVFAKKMDCPKCKGRSHNKDGIVNHRQRYLCKQCGCRYTVARKSDVKSAENKAAGFGNVSGRIRLQGNWENIEKSLNPLFMKMNNQLLILI